MAKKTTRRRKKVTTKKKKAGTRSGGSGRSSGRSAGRGGSLKAVSTTDLAREMRRREQGIDRLVKKRDRLLEQVRELNEEIEAAGGSAVRVGGGGGRKRPRNEQKLSDALVDVLKTPMSVTEAAEAVKAAGYKSSAENFRVIVNQTLLKDKRIEKVSRGVYRAKK